MGDDAGVGVELPRLVEDDEVLAAPAVDDEDSLPGAEGSAQARSPPRTRTGRSPLRMMMAWPGSSFSE